MLLTSKKIFNAVVGVHWFVSVGLGVGLLVHDPAFPQSVLKASQQTTITDLGPDLIKAKTCLGCHQMDSKRVGPGFNQIAERHGNTNGALDYLAGAIRQGGRGRWGAVPMPAQPQVSDLEAHQIASWILSLKTSPSETD